MSSTAASAPSRPRSRCGCSTMPATRCTAAATGGFELPDARHAARALPRAWSSPAGSTCRSPRSPSRAASRPIPPRTARRRARSAPSRRSRRRRLVLPDLPRQHRAAHPRHRARPTSCSRSAATGTTGTTSTRTAPPRRRRRSPRRRCTPSGSRTRRACARTRSSRMTFLGDGATSEGDAHEAFNFAAVWQTPTVFVVQNNQFAISVPLSRQTRAATLADKAVGYGMPGYHVDGNDVAAMYAVTRAAVERARSGGGPTLIEGLTYRIEAHTNSDDPTRYRHARDVEHWKRRDPIERLEKYLVSEGALTEAVRTEITDAAEAVAAHTRDVMTIEADLDPLELFDHVYARPRAALLEQRAALEAELAEAADARRSVPNRRSRPMTATTTEPTAARGIRPDAAHDGRRAERRAPRRDGGRRPRRRLRRGRRPARRRLPRHRRPAGAVRRGPHLGLAARRVGHRRHRDRHGDVRHAPGRRDAVRRVQLPGVRADGLARREDAQPHEGADDAADGRAHPLRGRDRRRRAPLRLVRGVLDRRRRASRS